MKRVKPSVQIWTVTEMKNKPYKGDWIHLVVKDFQKIGAEMDETVIKNTELGN